MMRARGRWARMKNPLYDAENDRWDGGTLAAQVEWIRLHLCTGPCGQSQSVMSQRERIGRTLKEVLARICPDECPGHGRQGKQPKCCSRAGEYNGFGSGPTIFTCPKGCSCHD